MEPVLDIRHLSISFATRARDIPAVMDFSVTVMPGECVGLVGESGCGKSTVALAIMRDLGRTGRVTGGQVMFQGRDLLALPEAELRTIRGRRIAMIYQEPMASLNPAMRVGDQLAEVPMLHEGLGRAEAMARARTMVADVRLPDPDRILRAWPHQLSGGQQQRIVIAMALMSRPDLLILDEPTTALDVTVEAGIVDLLRELRAKHGTSMLFISHNLGLIRQTCDRLCVMYSGEAVETGEVSEVFTAMRHPYTQALFRAIPLPGADKTARPLVPIPGNLPLPHERPQGCNFAPRCGYVVAGLCDVAQVPMFEVAPRHESRCLRWAEIDWQAPPAIEARPPAAPPGEVVLAVEGLHKDYRAGGQVVRANNGLSFQAREAETLAIVGESGCGKSTLARVLMGLEVATDGTVTLDGRSIADVAVQERGAGTVADLQMVFQNPFDTLNPSMTVGRQIVRAIEVLGAPLSDAARRERMGELLDLVRLPRAFADRMPRQLSGGQKQRVGIARALAGDARVVVADEPVSALDVSVQAAVTQLLTDIQRERGTTLLFISHDLSVVRYLSDRVLVMYLGHVVEIGPTERVFAPPYHPYTEALLAAVPVADPRVSQRRVVLEGEIPSAVSPPPGCPFQTRCGWKAKVPGGLCETELPPLREMGGGHAIRCHLPQAELDAMAPVFGTWARA